MLKQFHSNLFNPNATMRTNSPLRCCLIRRTVDTLLLLLFSSNPISLEHEFDHFDNNNYLTTRQLEIIRTSYGSAVLWAFYGHTF